MPHFREAVVRLTISRVPVLLGAPSEPFEDETHVAVVASTLFLHIHQCNLDRGEDCHGREVVGCGAACERGVGVRGGGVGRKRFRFRRNFLNHVMRCAAGNTRKLLFRSLALHDEVRFHNETSRLSAVAPDLGRDSDRV